MLLAIAISTAGWFLVGSVTGGNPDGAILGFSAAMWAAWDNEVLQQRRRQGIKHRQSSGRKKLAVVLAEDDSTEPTDPNDSEDGGP